MFNIEFYWLTKLCAKDTCWKLKESNENSLKKISFIFALSKDKNWTNCLPMRKSLETMCYGMQVRNKIQIMEERTNLSVRKKLNQKWICFRISSKSNIEKNKIVSISNDCSMKNDIWRRFVAFFLNKTIQSPHQNAFIFHT